MRALVLSEVQGLQQPARLLALTVPALGGAQPGLPLGSIQQEALSLNSEAKEVPRKRQS